MWEAWRPSSEGGTTRSTSCTTCSETLSRVAEIHVAKAARISTLVNSSPLGVRLSRISGSSWQPTDLRLAAEAPQELRKRTQLDCTRKSR